MNYYFFENNDWSLNICNIRIFLKKERRSKSNSILKKKGLKYNKKLVWFRDPKFSGVILFIEEFKLI